MLSIDSDNTETLITVQLKHLLLDVDFFDKPKIKALQYDYKYNGVLFFIAILCDMAKGTDSEVSDSCIKATGERFGFDAEATQDFIKYLITHNMIHRCANPLYLANRRVLKDQLSMALKQERWKRGSKAHREKALTNRRLSADTALTQRVSVNTEYMNIEHMNNEHMKTEYMKIEPLKVKAPTGKYAAAAESSLLSVTDDPHILSSNQFITQGRRPMIKHPSIHLAPWELADIFEQYETAGIPIDDKRIYAQAFKNVESKIKNKASKGEPTGNINAYSWLIGFAKTDLLKEYRASLDLKRSESYLNKAKQ